MVARFDPENPVFAPSERPFSAAAEISDSADAEWFDEQEAAAVPDAPTDPDPPWWRDAPDNDDDLTFIIEEAAP